MLGRRRRTPAAAMGATACCSATLGESATLSTSPAPWVVHGANTNKIDSEYLAGKKLTKRRREVKNRVTGVVYVLNSLKKTDTPCSDSGLISDTLKSVRDLDHPNILALFEVFDEPQTVHLVYQHARSVLLYQFIKLKHKQMNEGMVSKIVRQLFRVVIASAAARVCHGCLTPKEIYVQSDTLHVVVSDVGLVGILKYMPMARGDKFNIAFIAPEVVEPWLPDLAKNKVDHVKNRVRLSRKMDSRAYESADVWSVGCILYMLLTGTHIFDPSKFKTPHALAVEITSACQSSTRFQKKLKLLSKVGESARDAIGSIMRVEAGSRPQSEDIVMHTFFKDPQRLSALPLAKEVLSNVLTLKAETMFKRFMMNYISARLPSKKVKELEDIFNAVDRNGNGFIEVSELNNFIEKFPDVRKLMHFGDEPVTQDLLFDTFDQVDRSGDKSISMREFIAASLDSTDCFSDLSVLQSAFASLDKDHNGRITHAELESAISELEDKLGEVALSNLVAEILYEVEDGMSFEAFLFHLQVEGNKQETSCRLCPVLTHKCTKVIRAQAEWR